MKWVAYIAALCGTALLIVLVMRTGYQGILDSLALAGWNLLWLLPYHLLPVGLDAYGWRVLIKPRDPGRRARLPFLIWVALVREGVGRLLPVASVGAEVVGIRLVILRGLDGAAVTASVIIEVLVSLIGQYLFTAVCVILLVMLLQANEFTTNLLLGIVLTFPVPLLMLLMLRKARLFHRLERWAESLLGGRSRLAAMLSGGASLDTEIQQLVARRGRLLMSIFWQFSGMLAGSFEVWLALKLLGHGVSPAGAVALESVTLAVRHLAFFVPIGIGVQEAGLVVFGNMLGLSNDTALALALIKRMRELVMGVPALISWQIVEGLHLRRRKGGWITER